MTVLSDRFTRAVDYARIAHAAQVRKGTSIPYMTHLLGVAVLVIEHGGSEAQVIAGLLHDLLEDCGAHHEPIIRTEFGGAVADIVIACTDGTAEDKGAFATLEAKRGDWLRRKQEYLTHLQHAPAEVLLVSVCDKLHNARSTVQDLEDPAVGATVFARFTGGAEGTLWYYRSLSSLFDQRGAPGSDRMRACVSRMVELAAIAVESPGNRQ